MHDNDGFVFGATMCFITVLIFFLVATAINGAYKMGKNEVWQQAVEHGYAKETETSAGKVHIWNSTGSTVSAE